LKLKIILFSTGFCLHGWFHLTFQFWKIVLFQKSYLIKKWSVYKFLETNLMRTRTHPHTHSPSHTHTHTHTDKLTYPKIRQLQFVFRNKFFVLCSILLSTLKWRNLKNNNNKVSIMKRKKRFNKMLIPFKENVLIAKFINSR
jgi:hypothetical protein